MTRAIWHSQRGGSAVAVAHRLKPVLFAPFRRRCSVAGAGRLRPHLSGRAADGLELQGTVERPLEGPSSDHWFGTDTIGHDMFAQSMRGLRVSIHVSMVVAGIATVLGTVSGAVQGWFRGRVDAGVGLLVDFLLILPLLPVLMVLATRTRAIGGSSLMFVAVVIGLFCGHLWLGWCAGSVLHSEKEFIEAAAALGGLQHANHLPPSDPQRHEFGDVYATLTVATAILVETALAFLGFGIQPPEVSLGALVEDGRDAARTRWWLFYLPGAVLISLVLCVNFVGDGLRRRLRSRQRRRR